MTETEANVAESQKPTVLHRRCRLSRWSLLAGLLMAIAWILVAVPGAVTGFGAIGHFAGMQTRVHGWPVGWLFTFSVDVDSASVATLPLTQREGLESGSLLEDWSQTFAERDLQLQWAARSDYNSSRFWSDPRNWRLMGKQVKQRLVPVGLLIDLILAASCIVLTVALVERRLRAHKRLFQFSIRTMLTGMLIGGAVFGVALAENRASGADHRLDANRNNWPIYVWKPRSRVPEVLVRILDRRVLFPRATAAVVMDDAVTTADEIGDHAQDRGNLTETVPGLLDRIVLKPTPEDWNVDCSAGGLFVGRHVPQASSLVVFGDIDPTVDDWTWLESFPNLRHLIICNDYTPDPPELVRLDLVWNRLQNMRKLREIRLGSGVSFDPDILLHGVNQLERIVIDDYEKLGPAILRLENNNPALRGKIVPPDES